MPTASKALNGVPKALELFCADELEEALELLLRRWRQTRDATIADVIDLLDQRIRREGRAQAVSGDIADIWDSWSFIEAERRAVDFGNLLASWGRSTTGPLATC
jgi:hypothetical protein